MCTVAGCDVQTSPRLELMHSFGKVLSIQSSHSFQSSQYVSLDGNGTIGLDIFFSAPDTVHHYVPDSWPKTTHSVVPKGTVVAPTPWGGIAQTIMRPGLPGADGGGALGMVVLVILF